MTPLDMNESLIELSEAARRMMVSQEKARRLLLTGKISGWKRTSDDRWVVMASSVEQYQQWKAMGEE